MAGAVRATTTLASSDIQHTFDIPPIWITMLQLPSGPLQRRRRLCVVDSRGFIWEFWYNELPDIFLGEVGAPSDDLSYPIRVGCFFEPFEWQRFVLRNGLRADDRLTIEVQEPGFTEVRYRLSAQRMIGARNQDGEFCWDDGIWQNIA